LGKMSGVMDEDVFPAPETAMLAERVVATAASHVPFVSSGSYPVRGGNVVRPLVDGVPAFSEICRAVERAEASVWVTVTFLWDTFRMPEERGTFFDVLEAAAHRGVDVRVVFWRPDAFTERLKPNAFWGSAEHVDGLRSRRSLVKIRWDQARAGCAQHQKCWLIDAGCNDEVAFVGGINQNPHSMVEPGHRGSGQNHDIYVALRGPAVVDVHHNFVQRWNEASERHQPDGAWGTDADQDLPFPSAVGASVGTSIVQVQRTIAAGRITDGASTTGGVPFDIASGERSVIDQYLQAIDAARSSIYVENQYLEDPSIVHAFLRALERGIRIVVVLPGEPDVPASASTTPGRSDFLRARATLAEYGHFSAVGLAGLDDSGRRQHVYVHAKTMLVDDSWATIGSANLHWFSLYGNAEMNVSFWDPEAVKALRCELLYEHLDVDTRHLTDRAALGLLADAADANRDRWNVGSRSWQGNAHAIDLTTYGH
jgi:cardiolipin synthase